MCGLCSYQSFARGWEIPGVWWALYPRGKQQHVNMSHLYPSILENCKVHWWHISELHTPLLGLFFWNQLFLFPWVFYFLLFVCVASPTVQLELFSLELFLSYISQFIHTGWISYSPEKGWAYWHKIILGASDWAWTVRLGIWMEILLWEDLGSQCNSESSIFSCLLC